jgi:hypothetical protein
MAEPLEPYFLIFDLLAYFFSKNSVTATAGRLVSALVSEIIRMSC